MKKKAIWTGIILLLLVITGGVSYYAMNAVLYAPHEQTGTSNTEKPTLNADENGEGRKLGSVGKMQRIKNGRVQRNARWTEAEIMRTLHEMTHQKVVSSEKWGAVPMTLENVKAMIAIVRKRKESLEHYAFYRKMLNSWERGDFSQAVDQHNLLWKWEDGTVGRATRLMSPAEEKQFVRSRFGSVDGTWRW
ncbi:MAG TPA: DUF6241 domain-containing protein [Bacillales bacterium]|nr:DUF6241 domain-containing protein [Bacillales bacterium]